MRLFFLQRPSKVPSNARFDDAHPSVSQSISRHSSWCSTSSTPSPSISPPRLSLRPRPSHVRSCSCLVLSRSTLVRPRTRPPSRRLLVGRPEAAAQRTDETVHVPSCATRTGPSPVQMHPSPADAPHGVGREKRREGEAKEVQMHPPAAGEGSGVRGYTRWRTIVSTGGKGGNWEGRGPSFQHQRTTTRRCVARRACGATHARCKTEMHWVRDGLSLARSGLGRPRRDDPSFPQSPVLAWSQLLPQMLSQPIQRILIGSHLYPRAYFDPKSFLHVLRNGILPKEGKWDLPSCPLFLLLFVAPKSRRRTKTKTRIPMMVLVHSPLLGNQGKFHTWMTPTLLAPAQTALGGVGDTSP